MKYNMTACPHIVSR